MADGRGSITSRTRNRIVAAAIDALAAGDPHRLRRALTIDEVAAHAGLARRTVYSHFETMSDLLDAVLDDLSQPPTGFPAGAGIERAAAELSSCDEPARWLARRACAAMLGSDPINGSDNRVVPPRVLGTRLVSELAAVGRRPYAPLDPDQLARILVATTESSLLHGLDAAQTQRVILAVSGSLTYHDVAGSRHEPGQLLIDEVARSAALEAAGSEFPVLARTIVDTGLAVFDALGYAESTVEDIARQSGLSLDLISSLVGAKSEVARRLVSELAVAVVASVRGGRSAPGLASGLGRAVVVLANIADEHRSVVELVTSIDPVSRQPFGTEVLERVVRITRKPEGGSSVSIEQLGPVLGTIPVLALMPPDDRDVYARTAVGAMVSR